MALTMPRRGPAPGQQTPGAPAAPRPRVGEEPAALLPRAAGEAGFHRLLAIIALAGFAVGFLLL